MGTTPTEKSIIGTFINGRNATDDFLQLANNHGGTVFGWIDADGHLQGSLLISTGTPGGSNTDVQFNNSGSLGGDSGFTYDNTIKTVGAQAALLISPTATTQPVLVVTAMGATGSTGYTYRVLARKGILVIGDTTNVAIMNGAATLTSSNFNNLVWTAQPGADSYDVYRTASAGTPGTLGFLANVSTLTFNDTGIAPSSIIVPYTDTANSQRSSDGFVGISTGLQVGPALVSFPAHTGFWGIFPNTAAGFATVNINALPIAGISSGDAVGLSITAETSAEVSGQGSTALGLLVNVFVTDDADNRNGAQGGIIQSTFVIPSGTNAASQNILSLDGDVSGAGDWIASGDVCQGGIITRMGFGLTGTMDRFQGHTSEISNYSTGTITSLFHFVVNEQDNGSGGTITNAYGFAVDISIANSATFSAAFYSVDQGTAAGAWALYTAGTTPSRLGGNLVFAGSSSGTAAIGVAAAAGSPNKMLLPVLTGASGQILSTDGGASQQLAWTNVLPFVSAPSTATSAGVAGTMAFDSTHLYVCIATNTWIRASFAGGF